MTDRLFQQDGTPKEDAWARMRPGDLLNEADDRRAAVTAAKAGYDGSPDALARVRAAKLAYDRLRSYWRLIGEAAGTRRTGADVAPDVVAVTTEPKE